MPTSQPAPGNNHQSPAGNADDAHGERRLSIPLDPLDALRALLAVDPDSEPVGEQELVDVLDELVARRDAAMRDDGPDADDEDG